MAEAGKPRNLSDLSNSKFEFKNPISLDDVLTIEKKYQPEQIILKGKFKYKDTEITDFYVLDKSKKGKNIKEDYIKSRKSLIQDIKRSLQSFSASDLLSLEDTSVSDITIIGAKNNVDKIKKDFKLKKVKVSNVDSKDFDTLKTKKNHKPKKAPSPKKDLKNINVVSKSSTVSDSMVPHNGTSYFYPSSYGGRYVQQNMIWASISFSSDQTYEHDVFLYNYDGKTYLDGTSTAYPGCYPDATYAATSWPSASQPYLDTRFGENLTSCEIDELAFTIGAAQADALQAGTSYYTYIRTADGNDSSDKFKLQGQIGHRIPTSCYSTWCSFGDQSYNLVPAWSYTVPGTQPWIYGESPPNAPSNVSVTSPTNNSLVVGFTDNANNETNILLERKTGSGGSWDSLGGFGALDGTDSWYWENTGLNSDTIYCYRLKAVNGAGSSDFSNEACGTTTSSSSRSQVIVDDTSGGFSKGGSYWQEVSIGYNSHMFWTYVNGNAEDCWGEWQANLAGGNYEVYVFVPYNYATTGNAKYTIYHNGGSTVKSVNQNIYYDTWVSLGTYNFSSGTSRRVRLTDSTGETNYSLRVGFDAVGFVPR